MSSPSTSVPSLKTVQKAQAPNLRSIRTPLVVALVLFVLLPATITSILSAYSSIQTGRAQSINLLSSVTTFKSTQVTLWAADAQTNLASALNDPNISWVLPVSGFPDMRGDSVLRFSNYFDKLVSENKTFNAFFLMDKSGTIRLASDKTLNSTSLANQLDLKTALTQDTILPPVGSTGTPALIFLHPINDASGQPLAVLGARSGLNRLNEIMANRSGLGQTGESYLVDADLHLITDSRFPNYPAGSTPVQTDPARASFANLKAYSGLYTNYRGQNAIGAAEFLPKLNLALITEQEQAEIFAAPIQTLLGNILLTLIAVLIVAFISVQMANRRLVFPLLQLSDAANQVAGGNLNVATQIDRNDEFGLLGRTFNTMTGQLRESIDKLEERVAQRTVELSAAQKRAESASKAKSLFLSNMSHELRTPLNVVIGYSSSMLTRPQMFKNTPLNEVHRPYVQLIEESGQYLVGLINDILDLSKIESGKLELKNAPVSLPEIFRGVLATSTGLLKGKPVQLRPDFPDNLPQVWADSTRVRQIILNLMSNAIKFTDVGSVTLSARVENGEVRISVTDTGIGIPEKALETIFDRYQQVAQEGEKQHGGTGLGLDISKQLAQMHGGDLTVRSVVGQGSTFTFNLPLATPAQLPKVEVPEAAIEGVRIFENAETEPETLYNILIIEDEGSVRELLRQTLESAGYIVTDTANGTHALELAGGLLPDAILLDVRLPDISGWKVLESLKADPATASIPVVICTGDETDLTQQGVALYLKKPFTSKEVLDGVKMILQQALVAEKGN